MCAGLHDMSDDVTNVLKTILDALKPLTSEERQRTLEAALVFLGKEPNTLLVGRNPNTAENETAGFPKSSEAAG